VWGRFVRIVVSISLWLVIVFSSGGCTIIQQETTNRGGYLDYVLDQHWFKADSKRMRALRAFAIQVSLARIASVSAKNDSERQLLAIRIGATTKQFLPVYNCAIKPDPADTPGTEKGPCFYFDSAMVAYSTGLFDLAMTALPIDDAKNLVNTVTGTIAAPNPVAFGTLLNALLVIGRDALNYGRIVGGLYRDTIELEVQLWLATPSIDDRPPPYRVTEADVSALRAIYAGGNDNMPAWIATIATLRSQGLEPLPDPVFFSELGGLMKYICDLITKDATASNLCKANLPTTMAPPAAAVGPATPVSIGPANPAPPAPTPKPAAVVSPPNPAPPVSNPPPVASNPPPADSNPAPVTPSPAPVSVDRGTDPERTILMTYLHVGPKANQNLMQLVALPAIHAEILQDQGAGPIPPLFIIVDTVKYAPARKLMVQAGCQQGLFQKVNNATVASACKP
jgi:hypothetical protein